MYRVFDIAMCVGENYAFYVSHDRVMASCGFACLRVLFFSSHRMWRELPVSCCLVFVAHPLKLSLFKVVHLGKSVKVLFKSHKGFWINCEITIVNVEYIRKVKSKGGELSLAL